MYIGDLSSSSVLKPERPFDRSQRPAGFTTKDFFFFPFLNSCRAIKDLYSYSGSRLDPTSSFTENVYQNVKFLF